MPGVDIGIDLGTSRVKIFVDGKGIVLSEPAVIAYNEDTEEIVAMGTEAYDMMGKTSSRILVEEPLSQGVISSFDLAQSLIQSYLRKIKMCIRDRYMDTLTESHRLYENNNKTGYYIWPKEHLIDLTLSLIHI